MKALHPSDVDPDRQRVNHGHRASGKRRRGDAAQASMKADIRCDVVPGSRRYRRVGDKLGASVRSGRPSDAARNAKHTGALAARPGHDA